MVDIDNWTKYFYCYQDKRTINTCISSIDLLHAGTVKQMTVMGLLLTLRQGENNVRVEYIRESDRSRIKSVVT